ncbi:MAG TPA: alpha/beta fold hydrolase [Solirubrobacteraceae bacterium]|nr:alpha/beta fold hydrolase [Solirubrobacteraceae bacterium]
MGAQGATLQELAPRYLHDLAGRYDAATFEPEGSRARVRMAVEGVGEWDAVLEDGAARISPPRGAAGAVIRARPSTWELLGDDPRSGLAEFRAGRLSVRRNMHLGIGFLAATSGRTEASRLRFVMVRTGGARISTIEAGSGEPLIAIHGLGGTKGSFLPTVAELATHFRVIAADLPGFGDSAKPLGAPYDPAYFARAIIELMDALAIERAHLVGNSLGGRVAIELGMSHPERVGRLVLLCPALAWRRERPLVPLLRLTRPELGLVQIAPRPLVEAIVRRIIPGAEEGWTAAGVDEFLRAYLTPAGRAAFYAAARHIYLDEPHGPRGFWPRLAEMQAESLFVWGQRDRLVPIAFARHVEQALPRADHLELDCGHVPQIERPRRTHRAIREFLQAPGGEQVDE